MKKLIFLFAFAAIYFTGTAQSTNPRQGTGVNVNPGKHNYVYASKTDAAGADSVALATNAFVYTYRITLVDSFTLKQPTITNCYLGDHLQILLTAASGTPKLKFNGSNWQTAGTATLSTGLRGSIRLVFDGAKWIEESRVIQ